MQGDQHRDQAGLGSPTLHLCPEELPFGPLPEPGLSFLQMVLLHRGGWGWCGGRASFIRSLNLASSLGIEKHRHPCPSNVP